MLRMIRSSILVMAMLVTVVSSHAALIHISKSYSQPFTALQSNGTDTYEFQIVTPILIDKCMEYTGNGDGNGYTRNLDASGKSVVIFEDSSTYVIVDDMAAATSGSWKDDPTKAIFLWWWFNHPPGDNGTTGIIIKAAEGKTPVIDLSNMPIGISGNRAIIWWGNTVTGQTLTIQGIKFVERSGNMTYGQAMIAVYADASVSSQPGFAGGEMPYFKDCIFEVASALFIVWPNDSQITLGSGIEFDHCGFRLPNNTSQGYLMYSYDVAIPGTLNVSKCTFYGTDITSGSLAGGRWSFGYNAPFQVAFDHCIFNDFDLFNPNGVGSGHAKSYDYCLNWVTDPVGKTAGTGNVNADPLFVAPDINFDLKVGSPAIIPGDNMGYYQGDGVGEPVNCVKTWELFQ